MEQRNCKFGIFVSSQGITGDAALLTAANNVVAGALARGYEIIVLDWNDLTSIRSAKALVQKMQERWTRLKSYRTSVYPSLALHTPSSESRRIRHQPVERFPPRISNLRDASVNLRDVPVTYALSSEARYTTALAMSFGRPILLKGTESTSRPDVKTHSPHSHQTFPTIFPKLDLP